MDAERVGTSFDSSTFLHPSFVLVEDQFHLDLFYLYVGSNGPIMTHKSPFTVRHFPHSLTIRLGFPNTVATRAPQHPLDHSTNAAPVFTQFFIVKLLGHWIRLGLQQVHGIAQHHSVGFIDHFKVQSPPVEVPSDVQTHIVYTYKRFIWWLHMVLVLPPYTNKNVLLASSNVSFWPPRFFFRSEDSRNGSNDF